MRLTLSIAVVLMFAASCYAQSKDTLKAQLTASEIALEAAKQRNADTAGKVAGIAVAQKYQAANIAETAKAVEEVHTEIAVTGGKTNYDLQFLQATTENNGYIARKAEADAKIERAKSDALIAKAGNITTLITLVIAPVAVGLVGWWVKRGLTDVHSAIIETKAEAHAAYEIGNDNSMKIASIGLQLVDGRLVDPSKAPIQPPPRKPKAKNEAGQV